MNGRIRRLLRQRDILRVNIAAMDLTIAKLCGTKREAQQAERRLMRAYDANWKRFFTERAS